MGRAAAGHPISSGAAGKEPRITLRNYLDMSRSLNVEPNSRSHKNVRKWDMTKSLNADPGFFSVANRSRAVDSTKMNSVVAANSPIQETESNGPAARAGGRSKVNVGSLKSPLSDTGFLSRSGMNSKTLPTSPSVTDSPQEKQLIEAFVDQLRSIAASSSEPGTTTRRVVKKALEFSNNLTAQRADRAPTHDAAAAATSSGGSLVMDPRRGHRSKMRNVEGISQKRHRQLFPVVEEKQTVISSPIVHTASSIARTKLKSVDMAPAMQEHAIECASQLLKGMDKLNCKLVAWQLKKEFDKIYGPAWHCIVGTSFGSYVTHSVGGFIYFAVGKVSILLFRTAIEVVEKK